MSYEILEGNGKITGINGNTLQNSTGYPVALGNFSFFYIPESLGSHQISFIVTDNYGQEVGPVIIDLETKQNDFTVNSTQSQANTGDVVDLNFNITELGIGGDTYIMYFSTGSSNGAFEFQGTTYAAGESFTVPTGSFQGKYTGISESNHNIEFKVRSSSEVEKTADVNIQFNKYEEFFDLTVSHPSVDIFQDRQFPFSFVTNATAGHDTEVTYEMTFSFSGANAGFITYNGQVYREGETIPLPYGSERLDFTPLTEESFTIDFGVENSTGISQTASESVTVLKKPKVAAKGEKHNISCGGFNGCDYQVLIYTCFNTNCSEAYNGATLQQVEIRIYNRFDNRWDVRLFNYNDAQGQGVERYFELEVEPSEDKLRYLDQRYEVRVLDTNGQWSEKTTGNIIRV
ncbi:hypothetical protein D9V96_013840 [Zobellia laminariae]|uniref:hypothetical protein n=1 Tax=Zobellia laminariae TaxID=248906 RepID=UPI0040564448